MTIIVKEEETGKSVSIFVIFWRLWSDNNIESIFAYGYTTKKGGHGFGLHSCANYMTEMKGRLRAKNSETGKGAVFTLSL